MADYRTNSGLWLLIEQEVDAFIRFLFDPNRQKFVVLVSCGSGPGGKDGPLLDVDALRYRIKGRATIVVPATVAVNELLMGRPEMAGLEARDGAVRLIAPGALASDNDNSVHRLIPYQADFLHLVSQHTHWALNHVRNASPFTALKEMADRVAVLESRLKAKERELRTLRGRSRKQQRGTEQGPAPEGCRTVWKLHPERQLNYEIGETWYDQVAEYDRDLYPLPEQWEVGPDFIESIEKIQIVERPFVLATVVDILTGRAITISGRQVHRMRTAEQGDAPQLTRADGAVAFRAAVKVNTPSAPRLLWWVRKDGVIELGRVAVHDDMRLR